MAAPDKEDAMKTLDQFVKEHGTQEAAAKAIGVKQESLNRWLRGKRRPTGPSEVRLRELGIVVPGRDVALRMAGGKTMTLLEFVKLCGSWRRAGLALGVSEFAVRSWVKGDHAPTKLAQSSMSRRGVRIPGA